MSQGTEPTIKLPPELEPLYAPIRTELFRTEELLSEQLRSDHPFVDELVQHGFRLGGKRLRPALVLLSGLAVGDLLPDHLNLGATVELIHTATLVHDDVLDEADTRRHLATINSRWNNEASVLTGDYLLAQALVMAAQSNDMFAIRDISATCRSVCEGELKQIAGRGNYDLTESDYFEIIRGKTASLLACCCRLGSHYAGAEEPLVESLSRYGTHLGMAFQIADDLLDVLGDEHATGKSLGTDLAKQKLTLPLIRLLNQSDQARRVAIVERLSQRDPGSESDGQSIGPWREMLREMLDGTDAISYARAAATRQIELAIAVLHESLPPSDARDAMEGLARFVLKRNT